MMSLRQFLRFLSMGCSCPDVFIVGILSPCLCKHFHTLTINNLEFFFFLEDEDKKQIAEMKNILKHITSQSGLNFSSRESWTFTNDIRMLLVTG